MKAKLYEQIDNIDELTRDTCEICGGTYEENLDGSQSYFLLNGIRFKMIIQKC